MPNFFADLSFLLAVVLLALTALHGLIRPRRRWPAKAAWILLCTPPLLLVALTTYRYARGTARLSWFSSQPYFREFASLDPHYRAFVEFPRPELWWRWASSIEHYTFLGLFELFGPMPDTYLGPYPSRETARATLLHATRIGTPHELAAPIVLEGRTLQVPPPALDRALHRLGSAEPSGSTPALELALVDSSCLLLGYWASRWYHIELIDLSGHGWFAHYVFPVEEAAPLPPRH